MADLMFAVQIAVMLAFSLELTALYAISLYVNGLRESIITQVAMVLTLAGILVHEMRRPL